MMTIVLMIAALSGMQAPPKSDPTKPPPENRTTSKVDPTKPPVVPEVTLDQIIAASVRINPDVKIAEAEVQLAQAKLNAVKVAAAQRVTVMNDTRLEANRFVASEANRIRNLMLSVEYAAKAFDIAEKRVAAGTASQNELSAAKSQVLAAEARVTEAKEAQEAALLRCQRLELEWNRYRHQAAVDTLTPFNTLLGTVRYNLDSNIVTNELFTAGGAISQKSMAAPPKPADLDSPQSKLRAALDRTVKYHGQHLEASRVIESLVDLAGLSIRIKYPTVWDAHDGSTQFRISQLGGEMSLGAWLQLVTDEIADVNLKKAAPGESGKRYDFYVRDYGLQLATKETAAPGAIPLSEFWKIPLSKPAAVTAPAAKP